MLDKTKPADLHEYVRSLGVRARGAARLLSRAPTQLKNDALGAIASAIEDGRGALAEANEADLAAGRENGLSPPLLDRLELTEARILAMAESLDQLRSLPDPVGEVSESSYRPSGLRVGRMRVPLGVIGIIYESRPNVTADAAGLCLKAGNASILRGGSEAIHSNRAIAACIRSGLEKTGLPPASVQVIETTDRAAVGELIRLREHVDVIVPRGGKGLIERIIREASIPVIKHLDGNCHVYIDDHADADKANEIAFNAKTQRYAVCNAMETLLVAESIAARVLPAVLDRFREAGVEIRGCEKTLALFPASVPATEQDWYAEYLAPIVAVRVVEGIDAAIDHIETYGSHHTDAIVTENLAKANRFLREVDSSSVMVNASTRFADGLEYGLGAEIGISTDKLHARGPVGLEGLTCQKFVVMGDGHVRQ